MEETKVAYYIDGDNIPYLMKLPIPVGSITLADFKNALGSSDYKFFFKSIDSVIGFVKEEISDDKAILPCIEGRIISWLISVKRNTTSECMGARFQALELNYLQNAVSQACERNLSQYAMCQISELNLQDAMCQVSELDLPQLAGCQACKRNLPQDAMCQTSELGLQDAMCQTSELDLQDAMCQISQPDLPEKAITENSSAKSNATPSINPQPVAPSAPTPVAFGSSTMQTNMPVFGGTGPAPSFGGIAASPAFGSVPAPKPESSGGCNSHQRTTTVFPLGSLSDKPQLAASQQGSGFAFGMAQVDANPTFAPNFKMVSSPSFKVGMTAGSMPAYQPFQFPVNADVSSTPASAAPRKLCKAIRRGIRKPD